MEGVKDLFFVIPNSAVVTTNDFNLVQKFETFKIGKDGVHSDIIFMNVEASFESNNGDLQINVESDNYNSVTSGLVHIIVESVDTTIYLSEKINNKYNNQNGPS